MAKAIKPPHASNIGIKPHVDMIRSLIDQSGNTSLTEEELKILLEQLDIVRVMGLAFSNSGHGQDWLNNKIELAGYQLTGFGQCLGIVYMATQAFFLDDLNTFNERLRLIFNLPSSYFENDFQNPKQEIHTLIEQGDIESATKIQSRLYDIKAFFDGVALYANAEKHADWFEEPVPKQLPLEKSMGHLLPEGLLNPKENRPTYLTSFPGPSDLCYSLEDIQTFLSILASHFSEESFSLHFKSTHHIAGLFYDGKNKKWFHVQPDNLPGEEIHTHDLLALSIFNDFPDDSPQKQLKIEIYAQEKNRATILNRLDALKRNVVWSEKYASNPFKSESFDKHNIALLDIVEHERYEWLATQLEELDEKQIFDNVLCRISKLPHMIRVLKDTLPKQHFFEPLIHICLQHVSDPYKLLYALSVGNVALFEKLIQQGIQPDKLVIETINDYFRSPYNYLMYTNDDDTIEETIDNITKTLVQHLDVHADKDLEAFYIPEQHSQKVLIEFIKKSHTDVPLPWIKKSADNDDPFLLKGLLNNLKVTGDTLEAMLLYPNLYSELNTAILRYLKDTDVIPLKTEVLNQIFLAPAVSTETLIQLIPHQIPDPDIIHQMLHEREASLNKQKGFHTQKEKLRLLEFAKILEDMGFSSTHHPTTPLHSK